MVRKKDKPEGSVFLDSSQSEYYLNREIMWLKFDSRVLAEAKNMRNPLLSRIFFFAVVDANLDEFFMKRIGGLKQQLGAGLQVPSVDGRFPQEQLQMCTDYVRGLIDEQQGLEHVLKAELAAEGIRLCSYDELASSEQEWLDNFFNDQVYPLLTPQGMDPAHPFPFISNLSVNILVTVRYPSSEHLYRNRIKIPVSEVVPRFVQVNGAMCYVALEDIICHNLDRLLPEMEIVSVDLFRVTRNAITEKDSEQANDLLQVIETALRDRKFAEIVRLQVGKGMDPALRGMLAAELGIDEDDIFESAGTIGAESWFELARIDRRELQFSPHTPLDPPDLAHDARPIFHIIREKRALLLHHPFDSFDTSVERFLREASRDPKVLAIKITLYRTASQSRIIDYLIEASQNGKQVAVVVELKARFDESANIKWAGYLEQAGIHVTYGVVGLKTHSKVIFVVRKDYDGIRRYAHLGTGNYHAGTARGYCDLGLLSCDPDIMSDLTEFFNYLTTGYTPIRRYRKILPSPKILKKALLSKISREATLAQKGEGGHIQFKSNALEDRDIVAALYRASQAGVRIELIIRDTCRLRPGIAGLSENIRVISLVGRFLEHSRLFYFRNGGAEEYYIGSADLMKRNLESRVEACVPVEEPRLQRQLRDILDLQLANNRNVWELDADGNYHQPTGKGKKRVDQPAIDEQFIALAEKRAAMGRLKQAKRRRVKKAKK